MFQVTNQSKYPVHAITAALQTKSRAQCACKRTQMTGFINK